MKSIILCALSASFLFFTSPPLPAQPVVPIDPGQLGQSGVGPIALIGFADGRWLTATAERGISGFIGLQAGEAVTVQLTFPLSLVEGRIVAESLDGGILGADQPNPIINLDGTVNLTFQAGARPGLNRVALQTGGNVSLLRFWVLDPQNSLAHPPLLSPAP